MSVAHMGEKNPCSVLFVNMKKRSHVVHLEIDGRLNTKIDLKTMWEERGQA